MKKKTKNRLLLVIISAVIFYFLFIIYSNIEQVLDALSRFNLIFLPLVLTLVMIDYLLRSIRWQYFLNKLDINLSWRESIFVFLAGLSMTITPGKLGELIKPYILKDKHNIQVNLTIPVVFIERLTDIIGMMLLAAIGVLSFQYGTVPLILIAIIIIVLIAFVRYERLSKRVLQSLYTIPFLKKYAPDFEQAYDSTRSLISPIPLFLSTILSVCAWGIECFCLYLIFIGLNIEVELLEAVFMFSFPSIVGVVTMLPGGIGVTEGSIVGIAVIRGIELSVATTASLLIRFSTLWFGVIVGLIVLRYFYTSLRSKSIEDDI